MPKGSVKRRVLTWVGAGVVMLSLTAFQALPAKNLSREVLTQIFGIQ